MTKVVLIALAIAAFVPTVAQGSSVIAAGQDPRASAAPLPVVVVPLTAIGQLGQAVTGAEEPKGFSLDGMIDGVDHVLSSVDDVQPAPPNPFGEGGGAAAFTLTVQPASVAVGRGGGYDSAETTTEPLPEPATWLMMILGFFGLSFAVRRRGSPSGDRVRFS